MVEASGSKAQVVLLPNNSAALPNIISCPLKRPNNCLCCFRVYENLCTLPRKGRYCQQTVDLGSISRSPLLASVCRAD